MDILKLISTQLEQDFLSLSIKRVGMFRRSLMVELSDGLFGLSTYDCLGEEFEVVSSSLTSIVNRQDFKNSYFRAILLACLVAYYNQKDKLKNVTYEKAHHFLSEQKELQSIAAIGRFPFLKKIMSKEKEIAIFELDPKEDELGVDDYKTLSRYNTVFITAMTLMNGTFDEVFSFCNSSAKTILIGPTTPFHPALLATGLKTVAGATVIDGKSLWESLQRGDSFKHATGMSFWSWHG